MTNKIHIKKEFIQTLTETIETFDLIDQKDAVLAAVSGGPDSIALAVSLLALREKYAITIGIAHLNHMLRGEESLRDEAFTKAFAHRLGLPFHCEQTNVRIHAKKHGISIEEAGRDIRYRFFDQIAAGHGYTKIATGHNKDDNAELVLMNLLRGAGPKGLCGIPPIRDSKYIRPLIQVSKNQILDFLKAENQASVFDSSNKDMRYLRNKIRYQLMPQLQLEYNPEIMDALDRLSHILKQEEDFWDLETRKKLQTCLVKSSPSCLVLSKSVMAGLHPAILNRIFRKAIQTIKKDLNRISLAHINDAKEFCFNTPSGVSLDLPGQIRIYKNKNFITIKKEAGPLREIGKKEKKLQQISQKNQVKES